MCFAHKACGVLRAYETGKSSQKACGGRFGLLNERGICVGGGVLTRWRAGARPIFLRSRGGFRNSLGSLLFLRTRSRLASLQLWRSLVAFVVLRPAQHVVSGIGRACCFISLGLFHPSLGVFFPSGWLSLHVCI